MLFLPIYLFFNIDLLNLSINYIGLKSHKTDDIPIYLVSEIGGKNVLETELAIG